MVGVAAALAGAVPRFAPFAWGVLLVTFMVTEIGPLDEAALVGHGPLAVHAPVARCPAARSRSSRRCVLTLIALALMAGGFLAYRRRDVI